MTLQISGYDKAVLCFPGVDDDYEKKIIDRARKIADNEGYCEVKHGDQTLFVVESEV